MSNSWNWDERNSKTNQRERDRERKPTRTPSRGGVHGSYPEENYPERRPPPHHPNYPTNPTSRPIKPGISNSSRVGGLGTTGIVFIALGSALVVIVIILCIVLSCRRSSNGRRRNNLGGSRSTNSIQFVGRGIQRPSFLPFRLSSRNRTNEPIVVNYPDPDTHLPNYPIQTPYTFSSTTSLTQQGQHEAGDKDRSILQNKQTSAPNHRATIY